MMTVIGWKKSEIPSVLSRQTGILRTSQTEHFAFLFTEFSNLRIGCALCDASDIHLTHTIPFRRALSHFSHFCSVRRHFHGIIRLWIQFHRRTPASNRHRNAIIATLRRRTFQAALCHEDCRCSNVEAKDCVLFHPKRQHASLPYLLPSLSEFPPQKKNDSRRRRSARNDRRCAGFGNVVHQRTHATWTLTSAATAES